MAIIRRYIDGGKSVRINLNSAVKTRSTRRPQSRKDGIAVSEMFTCEVEVQLGLRDGFLLRVLRDLRVSIEFFRIKTDSIK